MQPVGPTLEVCDPPAGLVDQVHAAVPHDVVDVAPQEGVAVQRQVDLGERPPGVLGGVQLGAEGGPHGHGARLGQEDVPLLRIRRVVHLRLQGRHHVADRRTRAGRTGCAGQHERLVHEHGVGFVDHRRVQPRLHQLGHGAAQPVPEQVETDLAHGGVGDLRPVGGAPLVRGAGPVDDGHPDPEQLEERRHPVCVAPGQVVVDRDDVHRAAAQGEGPGRDRTGEGLALAGGHVEDVAARSRSAARSWTSNGRMPTDRSAASRARARKLTACSSVSKTVPGSPAAVRRPANPSASS